MSMCVKEKYSARELARQIDSGYYERYILSQKPFTPAIEESKSAIVMVIGLLIKDKKK